MFKSMTAATCVAAALMGATPAGAHIYGGFPVFTFDSAPISSDTQLSLGFTFTVLKPLPIRALGYWDQGGDGLMTDHQVGIFYGDGTLSAGPLVVSTVVKAGKSGELANFGPYGSPAMYPSAFRYAPVPFTILEPGQYTIAGLSPEIDPALNDQWVYGGPDTGFRLFPYFPFQDYLSVGPDAARYTYGTPTLTDPSSHYSDYIFYAVNFSAAPEPSSWILMLVGFGGIGWVASQRRRSANAETTP